MPILYIDTNLPRSKIPADFLAKAIPVMAKTLDRPENVCVVYVTPDVVMSFGGSTEPCAISCLVGIQLFSAESNRRFAKIFFDFIEESLGIPTDKMLLRFQNLNNEDSSFKGLTIADILSANKS